MTRRDIYMVRMLSFLVTSSLTKRPSDVDDENTVCSVLQSFSVLDHVTPSQIWFIGENTESCS
jgi:hypothetical protein